MKGGAILLLGLLVSCPASAMVEPRPSAGDARLTSVLYDPDQVVLLKATLGFQLTVEFSDDERIENVAIGDGASWQVTPNKRATLLFIKPVESASDTNMTVVTTLRRYMFELSVRKAPNRAPAARALYAVRFTYPPAATPSISAAADGKVADATPATVSQPGPPEARNLAYSYGGAPELVPLKVFDDGARTYFKFAENAEYPAIFSVEEDKSEAVINFRLRDGLIVVDRVAPGFVLRRGKLQTRIFNDGFRASKPGPESPRKHSEKGGRP